jgi:small subunit ribosomal protein S6
MYIMRPDLPDLEADAAIAKYQDFLVKQEAEEITTQHRGRRRLAYDIKGHREGIYIQVNYLATPTTIESLEKSMRLADDVIRYMTIKLDPETVDDENAEEIPDAEALVVEVPIPSPAAPVLPSQLPVAAAPAAEAPVAPAPPVVVAPTPVAPAPPDASASAE